MNRVVFLVVVLAFSTSVLAQQPNSLFSALNFNAPADQTVASPVVLPSFTDSCVTVNVKAFPGTPTPVVILTAGSVGSGASFDFGAVDVGGSFQLDLDDVGQPGYADQVVADGYVNPTPDSFTDVTGNLSVQGAFPACVTVNNVLTCVTQTSFELAYQAITIDPTQIFNLNSTAPGRVRFTRGFQEYNLVGDSFGIFNFLGGFTFKYYGRTYTRAWLSANGYVSFTQASTGFPSPSVGDIRSGTPRIMCFYNDLQPEVMTHGPRIFAQQFEDCDGTRKVRFVHFRLAEFSDLTGPHGGEINITENGDIAVFVEAYNTVPSINTGVGITPGTNIDTSPSSTPFGRDLVVDTVLGPTALGAGKLGFELFDHGNGSTPVNPMNGLIAFGFNNNNPVGPGVVYTVDPSLANTAPANSGYIVEPFQP